MSIFDSINRLPVLDIVFDSLFPKLPEFTDELSQLSDLACEAEFIIYEAEYRQTESMDPEIFAFVPQNKLMLSW
jgi:hypothetical protein